jgi:DNA-binding GntR family transcriptional regulator
LQLTQEGLLVAERNCGVRVGSGPSQAIQPLVVSLRRQIEVFALDAVFPHLTDADDARWQQQLDDLHEACKANDAQKAIEHDIAFHRSIVERTGDADLVAIWLPIITRMLLRYSRHNKLMDVYREHAKAVKAIKARNKKAAIAALEANIV